MSILKSVLKYGNLGFLLLSAGLFTSCWWYSFSGTSIDPEAKTISVKYIENRAERINPSLSNTLTEALQDRYVKQTRLALVSEEGDYQIEGEIVSYTTQPMAVTAEEVAAQNRLTVNVKIRFINKINPKKNFNKNFSSYEDYASTLSLDAVENSLCETIVEKIVEEIFNATVADW